MSSGQGSTGKMLAAICSFFPPGLGRLVLGRLLKTVVIWVLAIVPWIVWSIGRIRRWFIYDAASYKLLA